MGERGRNRTREVGGSDWPLAGSFATPNRLLFSFLGQLGDLLDHPEKLNK